MLPAPVAPLFPALILQAHAAPGAPWSPWSPWGCPEAQGLTGGTPPLVLAQGDLQLGQWQRLSLHQVLTEEPALCSIYRRRINWCVVNLFFLKRDLHTGESF